MVVALDDGRDRPEAAERGAVEIPHLVAHKGIVRVDDVAHVVLVAGEVELHDAVGRDAVDELMRRRSRD